MLKRPKLYFAAPLFSRAERTFNADLAAKLKPYFDVYLPQRDGGLLSEYVAGGMSIEQAERKIYNDDIHAIRKAAVFLIVLDGRTIDEGAAYELGFANALKKPCYGLQTDPRRLLPHGNNPMIGVPLKQRFENETDLLRWAKRFANRA